MLYSEVQRAVSRGETIDVLEDKRKKNEARIIVSLRSKDISSMGDKTETLFRCLKLVLTQREQSTGRPDIYTRICQRTDAHTGCVKK